MASKFYNFTQPKYLTIPLWDTTARVTVTTGTGVTGLGMEEDYWSERRCADGFVETAVGHYFWYFSFLVVVVVLLVTTVAKMA